ncbi:MAG: alpha/beta hydrolase [Puniceicoccales bacterium]|nr:alpha/beta hydrolase [Puniceicoccales bacterium]
MIWAGRMARAGGWRKMSRTAGRFCRLAGITDALRRKILRLSGALWLAAGFAGASGIASGEPALGTSAPQMPSLTPEARPEAFATTASGPAWWAEQAVLREDEPPQDFAAINQGQLKNLSLKAALALEASLPGGAGNEVLDRVALWLRPSAVKGGGEECAAVSIGQLKAVALPFYQRLEESGLICAADYPWAQNTRAAFHAMAANAGQAKRLFSFHLPPAAALADTDGDGIPDVWERILGFDPAVDDAGAETFPGSGETRAARHARILARLAMPSGESGGASPSEGARAASVAPDAARPFYAAVDLGPAGMRDTTARTTLSERNAWLLLGTRRWNNGRVDLPAADVPGATAADIRSDGAVLLNRVTNAPSPCSQVASIVFANGSATPLPCFDDHTSAVKFLRDGRIFFTLARRLPEGATHPANAAPARSYSIAGTASNLDAGGLSTDSFLGAALNGGDGVFWSATEPRQVARNGDFLDYSGGTACLVPSGHYPALRTASGDSPALRFPGLSLSNLNEERIAVGRDPDTNAPVFTFAGRRFFLPPPVLKPLGWPDTSASVAAPRPAVASDGSVQSATPPPAVRAAPLLINSPAPGSARAGFHTITDGRNLWFRKATPQGFPATLPGDRPGSAKIPTGTPDYADPVPVDICVDATLREFAITAINGDGLLAAMASTDGLRMRHLLLVPAEHVGGVPRTPAEHVTPPAQARIREHPGLTPGQIAATATMSPSALAVLLRGHTPVTLRFPAFADSDSSVSNFRLRAGDVEYPLRRFPGRDPVTGSTRDYFYPVEPGTPWAGSPKIFLPAAAGASVGPRLAAPGYDPETKTFRVRLIVKTPEGQPEITLGDLEDWEIAEENEAAGKTSSGNNAAGAPHAGSTSIDSFLGGAAWGVAETPVPPSPAAAEAASRGEVPNSQPAAEEIVEPPARSDARPFYSIIDLGPVVTSANGHRDFECHRHLAVISEKNAWIGMNGYRWHISIGWKKLEKADQIHYLCYNDVADDGRVLATVEHSPIVPGFTTNWWSLGISPGGLYWDADGRIQTTPSTYHTFEGDNEPTFFETWGLKFLHNGEILYQLCFGNDHQSEIPGENYHGISWPFGLIRSFPAEWNPWNNLMDENIACSRNGELLSRKIPGILNRAPSTPYFDKIHIYLYPDSTRKTPIHTYPLFSANALNDARIVVGSNSATTNLGEKTIPLIGVGGSLFELPRSKDFPSEIPSFINAPPSPRQGHILIASRQCIWLRKTDPKTGKLPENPNLKVLLRKTKTFHPAAHITEFMDPAAAQSWKHNDWNIGDLNNEGLMVANATKLRTPTEDDPSTSARHTVILVPGNLVKFIQSPPQDTDAPSAPEWKTEKIQNVPEMQHPRINTLGDQELETMEPCTFRIAVVDSWVDNPQIKLSVSGASYSLKKFQFKNAITDEMEEHLYPVESAGDSHPKRFIFSKVPLTGKFRAPGHSPGNGEYTFSLRVRGKENLAMKVKVIPEPMSVDADHDGKITDEDAGLPTAKKPFRHWINEDADDGDVNNSGSNNHDLSDGYTNGRNDKKVNGRADLADFFPVWLDLMKVKQQLPRGSGTNRTYHLCNESSAMNFAILALKKDNALDYQRMECVGWDINKFAREIPLRRITKNGTLLPVKGGADPDGLLLIVEGLQQSDKNRGKLTVKTPLVFQVREENRVIYESKIPISLSPVREMYRWINLRPVLGENTNDPTNISDPRNHPDAETNGRHFLFAHGFSVSGKDARAWGAEMFKRLRNSGSNAAFTMVTWRSDQRAPLYYSLNVNNAFLTAPALTQHIANLPGSPKYIAAHSLGNMLVSSAINDHNLNVEKYFMLNAAVPRISYEKRDTGTGNAHVPAGSGSDFIRMRHPEWAPYSGRLFAGNWWKLFPTSDPRRALTWQGRFANVSNAHNFYSEGEEVLDYMDGLELYPGDGIFPGGERSWVYQEKKKDGWKFSKKYGDSYGMIHIKLAPGIANAFSDEILRDEPFFLPFPGGFHGAQTSPALAQSQLDQLLAETIPSLSIAAGREPVEEFKGERNYDMNKSAFKVDWPEERMDMDDKTRYNNWLHSDANDVAYFYTHRLFDKWVELGNLNKKQKAQP